MNIIGYQRIRHDFRSDGAGRADGLIVNAAILSVVALVCRIRTGTSVPASTHPVGTGPDGALAESGAALLISRATE
ncbi:hypothetical protein NUM_72430 [Actinocatenispora comari]|uniref:Uncharacterized protein n=1 Tax=Actinocatenispora comari TaxID=2807577 RepID=A0A8J4ESI9_9ACTN|nr:hypothetical protein NUM_72430 [Actinocatenispora comari]